LTIWGSFREWQRHEASANSLYKRDEMVVSYFMETGSALALEMRGSKWSEETGTKRMGEWTASAYGVLKLLRPDLAEEFMIEGFPIQSVVPGHTPVQTAAVQYMDRRLWRLKEIHDKIQVQLLATKS
jgi:hypothetical protein